MKDLTVLIACENSNLTHQITEYVGTMKYKSINFHNAHEAMDYIVEYRPQLVFLSENLSDMNAQDFIILASQKKVFSTTTFVLLSLHPYQSDDKMRMMTLGFSNFITYVFDEDDKKITKNCIEDEIRMMTSRAA